MKNKACFSVQALYLWKQDFPYPLSLEQGHPESFNDQYLSTIARYWQNRFPNTDKLDVASSCYLLYGNALLDWPGSQLFPDKLRQHIEYRFSWHAWHHASACLLEFSRTQDRKYLFAAADYASGWLSQSYFQNDPDYQYAWYDHGTPVRLECMLVLYVFLLKNTIDIRLTKVLRGAIYRHAMLLANEGFYAFNQPYRWHNHALFQDMALLGAAIIFDDCDASPTWIKTALARIEMFFSKVLLKEGDFYISFENSSSYHNGLISLMKRVNSIVQCIGNEGGITRFIQGMERFSALIAYADGRNPTFGDSYRHPPREDTRNVRQPEKKELYVFSRAGYAILHGACAEAAYTLTFIASSASITHKHADNCSFSLYLDGIEWLIDPSYYSFCPDDPVAKYLRGSLAHNTLTLDGLEYLIDFKQTALEGKRDEDAVHLEMTQSCYENVEVRRRVTGSLSSFDYTFTDSIAVKPHAGKANFQGRLMFHCGEGVAVEFLDGQTLLTHPNSAFVVCIDGISRKPLVHYDKMSQEESSIRGITGHGFRQKHAIYTIEFIFQDFSAVSYSIKAEKKNGMLQEKHE